MPSRTLESGMKAKESLLEQNPNSKLDVMEMDLSSLESVRKFAQSFNSRNKHLNILMYDQPGISSVSLSGCKDSDGHVLSIDYSNNAGIMACPFQLSKDGIELQFATNHLGINPPRNKKEQVQFHEQIENAQAPLELCTFSELEHCDQHFGRNSIGFLFPVTSQIVELTDPFNFEIWLSNFIERVFTFASLTKKKKKTTTTLNMYPGYSSYSGFLSSVLIPKYDSDVLPICEQFPLFHVELICLKNVGHYLLTSLLLDKLKTTAKETGIQGRIINVSSTAHRSSDGSFFDLEKLNDQSRQTHRFSSKFFILLELIKNEILYLSVPLSFLQVQTFRCICSFEIGKHTPCK